MIKPIIIILGLLFLLLQGRLWFGDGNIAGWLALKKQLKFNLEDMNGLTRRNELLSQDLKFYKANPESLEEKARYELGMLKKGETFYHVVETVR